MTTLTFILVLIGTIVTVYNFVLPVYLAMQDILNNIKDGGVSFSEVPSAPYATAFYILKLFGKVEGKPSSYNKKI